MTAGPPRMLVIAVLASVLAMAVLLFVLWYEEAEPPGVGYIPARLENGRVVPERIAPIVRLGAWSRSRLGAWKPGRLGAWSRSHPARGAGRAWAGGNGSAGTRGIWRAAARGNGRAWARGTTGADITGGFDTAMTAAPARRIVPPSFLSEPTLAALLDLLPEARIVCGAVRDTLAERPLVDVDLASPLAPETVMERLLASRVKVVPTGLAHGTVTAVLDDRSVEITTLRRKFNVETDGRHRSGCTFTDDWREDAARRDFTINAMSMTCDGADI